MKTIGDPSPKKGVSCLCLTYGRPHLLEEAIESFLRQDWTDPKELVVLNDHPEQRLVYDHPEVRVFNLATRVGTLGEKRNRAAALARYPNLLPWDDDDIYLPWRIAETMMHLPARQYFKCPYAWCITSGEWAERPVFNMYHAASGYTRWLFEAAGGYGSVNGGEDADLEARFRTIATDRGPCWQNTTLPWDRVYYVYRWGHGSYHATGCVSLDDIRPSVQWGTLELHPRWHQDYAAIAIAKAHRLMTTRSEFGAMRDC